MQDKNAKDTVINKYLPTLPYLNPERTQKFFSIVLTLIALSFFGIFAINPTISTIIKLKKEVSDSEFVGNQLDSKIKNLSLLRKQYVSLQNDLTTISDAIPREPDVHLLFAQLQTIAKTNSIKIKKLQNSEVEVLKNDKGLGKQYYSYPFSIGGQGTFQSISDFVRSITNMQRIIDIELFSITNQESQSLGFNIQGTAFFKE